MPRRLAALLLDLLLLQLLLLGGSGECITRVHPARAVATAVATVDPHAAHRAHASHAMPGVSGERSAADAPVDDGATSGADGFAVCMMAASCTAAPLAARVPSMDGTPLAHAAAVAPQLARPVSPAFSPEPPPPRA